MLKERTMKKADWHPWFYQHHLWYLGELSLSRDIPERYRTLIALALSVAHWHPDNKGRGGRADACPLCALFYRESPAIIALVHECHDCPLVKLGQWCNDPEASWMRWHVFSRWKPPKKKEAKIKANEVYQHLLTAYAAEYRRVME